MFPTNSERLIGISDAFSAFVYGYPSSCPRAQCTPTKSVTTLRYTRKHGPIYPGQAWRHLPSAVPWIFEDRLFLHCLFSEEGAEQRESTRRLVAEQRTTDRHPLPAVPFCTMMMMK